MKKLKCVPALNWTHNYSKWVVCKSFEQEGTGRIVVVQYRECLDCGYKQFKSTRT